MNFHRRSKGDDDIYFGYRFWFHCQYEQNGLFLEAFFTPMAFLEYDSFSNNNCNRSANVCVTLARFTFTLKVSMTSLHFVKALLLKTVSVDLVKCHFGDLFKARGSHHF